MIEITSNSRVMKLNNFNSSSTEFVSIQFTHSDIHSLSPHSFRISITNYSFLDILQDPHRIPS